jgi:uncharacterized membrane protein
VNRSDSSKLDGGRCEARAPGRRSGLVSSDWLTSDRGFLTAFAGTALGCLLLIVVSALRWEETASKLAIAGALAYLIGTFGVTMWGNVPLNDRWRAGSARSSSGCFRTAWLWLASTANRRTTS